MKNRKLLIMMWLVVAVLAGATFADTHYVDPAGSNTPPYTSPSTAAHMIQDAIDEAAPGDTVSIAAATYAESDIHIDRSIMLNGAGIGSTTLDPGGSGVVLFVDADDVTIRDMTIRNASQAIRFEMAGSTIDNTNIEMVSMEDNSSRGIEVHNATTVTNLTIDSCTVDNCNVGLRTASSGVLDGCDILDSTFSNNVLGFYNANDGNTSLAKNIMVDGCTFSSHSFAAFYAEEIQESTVQNSQFLDNARGFYIFKIYTTTGGGIDAKNILVQNCDFVDTTGTGTAVLLINDTGYDNINIVCNNMTGGARGVFLSGMGPGWGTVGINFNSIFSNGLGVEEDAAFPLGGAVVDCENNWWGHPTGPLDLPGTVIADNDNCAPAADIMNPLGLGNEVADAVVDYCPWAEAADNAELDLNHSSDWLPVGGQLTVCINLSGDPKDPIVGGQFYLNYDSSKLQFDSAMPGDPPFTLEVFPAQDTGSTIFYAVGVPGGGPGTTADTKLAVLTFTTLDEVCDAGGLVSFAAPSPPLQTRLTDEFGQLVAAATTDLNELTIDSTPPDITCPPDITVACIEDADPGLPYATVDGGVAIHYNDNGMGEVPSNQAYMKAQFDAMNPGTGAPLLFSSVPLTGFGPVTWQGVYSGLTPPDSQFGFDMVLPLPTMDGSVLPPVLTAYDNVDNTVPGAAPAGPVTWAINDYKPHTPDITAGDVINSIVRSQSPGVPASDVMILRNDVSQSGSIFTADIEGKLVSDGTHHWFNPATPHSPMSNFGLNGDFFFSGTLTYDVNTDTDPLMDFYEGTITLTANHISSVVGFATATDNCTMFPVIDFSDTDNGGSGCPGDPLIITRTWTATDDCGNQSSCVQTITVEDNVAPTFLSVPDDITVLADAGTCSAVVDPGMAEATDNCLAGATVTATRDDSMLLTDPYPVGDTTITWTATDACGNMTMVDQIVTVEGESEMIIDLAYDITLNNAAVRCIEFVLDGNSGTVTVEQDVMFDTNGEALGVSVLVPCGDYDCVTARDTLHSLASSVDLNVSGTQYVASATGADELITGNLNGDLFIDILDFGILVGQFGTSQPIDTDCMYVGPHADINASGGVTSGDFTSIQINFLEASDTGCTALVFNGGGPAAAHLSDGRRQPQPVRRISVAELHRRGLHDLAVADLNHDKWLDEADIAAFLAGARP